MIPEELLKLLGVKAILLPIPKGSKRPCFRKWQRTSFAATQEAPYQKRLASHGNTGVLLGKASENLCSIDLDDGDALIQFLEMNPPLCHTLRTAGNRGANLWLVLTGEYPSSHTLKNPEGNPVGEWRADGNQTIIQGTHPKGMAYRILVNSKPLKVDFADIKFPIPPPCYIDGTDYTDDKDDKEIEIIQTNTVLCVPPDTSQSLPDKIAGAEQAQVDLEKDGGLHHLYATYIERKFFPQQGERNNQLVAMISFLFRVVSEKRAFDLAMAFYDINQDVFADSREQHQNEAASHLLAVKNTWKSELSEVDVKALENLPPLQAEVFRICRDLAIHQNNRGMFFLSCRSLGQRVKVKDTQASRMLRQLEGLQYIKTVTKGSQHSKTKGKGKPTTYKWLLPLPLNKK